MGDATGDLDTVLTGLRRRADEDFLTPPAVHTPHRHQADLPELGLRVSVTRSRYPNRPGGSDEYAVTISRGALDRAPDPGEVGTVLAALFGAGGDGAVERGGGPLVRLYRVAAGGAGVAP